MLSCLYKDYIHIITEEIYDKEASTQNHTILSCKPNVCHVKIYLFAIIPSIQRKIIVKKCPY